MQKKGLFPMILFFLVCFLAFIFNSPFASEAATMGKTAVIDLPGGVKLEMVVIPAGRFMMGSPLTEKYRNDDEGPQHQVSLDGFYLGKFEVTQAQWRAVMGKNPSKFPSCDECPVESISLEDIQEFIQKINETTGQQLRLPTEAEWEYACRAGTDTLYYTGNDLTSRGASGMSRALDKAGWYYLNSDKRTHPAGKKQPNAFGLYDMHGNVSEWCADVYQKNYYAVSAARNPRCETLEAKTGVLRGGSWYSPASFCRSAIRLPLAETKSRPDRNGFRLAQDLSVTMAATTSVPKPKPAGGEEVVREPRAAAATVAAPKAGKVMVTTLPGAVKLEMVTIPAGKFLMGSDSEEMDRNDDEGPQRQVSISGFSIGRYEITQAQWKAVMGNNPSHFRSYGGNYPAEKISWDNAQAFIQKLNQLTGRRFRLPTEAEWEYACRAGTTTTFNTGKCLSTDQGNFDGRTPYKTPFFDCGAGKNRKTTMPVGSLPPNTFGLYDMHGNVSEWCQDWYQKDFYSVSSHRNPICTDALSGTRVLRGGNWVSLARDCRSARRIKDIPMRENAGFGFRLAEDLPAAAYVQPEEK